MVGTNNLLPVKCPGGRTGLELIEPHSPQRNLIWALNLKLNNKLSSTMNLNVALNLIFHWKHHQHYEFTVGISESKQNWPELLPSILWGSILCSSCSSLSFPSSMSIFYSLLPKTVKKISHQLDSCHRAIKLNIDFGIIIQLHKGGYKTHCRLQIRVKCRLRVKYSEADLKVHSRLALWYLLEYWVKKYNVSYQ